MMKKEVYLVLDIGTGNIRAAVVTPSVEILGIARADIRYYRDTNYPESIYFDPGELWTQLTGLVHSAIEQAGDIVVRAITTTSQREGIVLVNKKNKAIIGLPNIDHRGREWENIFPEKDFIYRLSGRYPTSLFSAYKLIGIRERRKEIWQDLSFFLSISDWAAWALSGVPKYEHSQASETLLYDVAAADWSTDQCHIFGIARQLLPDLELSGTIAGKIIPAVAAQWHIDPGAKIIIGGGDTQMAIKSTRPAVGDVVIVSGTTTPVVKLESSYITDQHQRTWTSRDIVPDRFMFEANAGVTGLNYQRLKEVFYPNEGYEVMEKELQEDLHTQCVASLGSLVAGEKKPVVRGGFVFPVPVPHELRRSSFIWATLTDICFSIVENYKVLAEVSGHTADYIWACGGGMQSVMLRKLLATVTGKDILVREHFEQATVAGAAILCNEACNVPYVLKQQEFNCIRPDDTCVDKMNAMYHSWKEIRESFRITD
ncbi:MAG: FGGY family carbohydrate kinase [Niabella sp.]